MVFAIVGLILGLVLLVYSSNKAIEHTIKIALEWGITPFVTGLVIVSIGTDFPEIVNSIISSSIGHADIQYWNLPRFSPYTNNFSNRVASILGKKIRSRQKKDSDNWCL
jgi:xanthine/uracil permease